MKIFLGDLQAMVIVPKIVLFNLLLLKLSFHILSGCLSHINVWLFSILDVRMDVFVTKRAQLGRGTLDIENCCC